MKIGLENIPALFLQINENSDRKFFVLLKMIEDEKQRSNFPEEAPSEGMVTISLTFRPCGRRVLEEPSFVSHSLCSFLLATDVSALRGRRCHTNPCRKAVTVKKQQPFGFQARHTHAPAASVPTFSSPAWPHAWPPGILRPISSSRSSARRFSPGSCKSFFFPGAGV